MGGVVVGEGVVELGVEEGVEVLGMGEGRLQGGAKARWLQLLMEGSYLDIMSVYLGNQRIKRSPGSCWTKVSVALSRPCAS